jgi:hypothetical protein
MKHWSNKLVALRACSEAIEYAKTQPDFPTAWDNCKRGDWLLWLAAKLPAQVTRQQLIFAACQCARLALPYTKDARVLTCIEVTEAWTRNEATIEQVNTARRNAAAADAAYAAYAAADAAADAAAAYAAAYAARNKTLLKCADIVRQHITVTLQEHADRTEGASEIRI